MWRAFALLAALALVGCSGQTTRVHVPPITEAATALILLDEPAPVDDPYLELPERVRFAITWIRDWSSPFYSVDGDDLTLTKSEAERLGIPAALWLHAALTTPEGYAFGIYLVRTSRL